MFYKIRLLKVFCMIKQKKVKVFNIKRPWKVKVLLFRFEVS